MAWDGIYRAKVHFAKKRATGGYEAALCAKRYAKRKTDKLDSVSCFACLKKLGIIK